MNSFSKNSVVTFFSEAFIFVLSFAISIIISRILGPEGRGIYSITLVIPAIFTVFSSFGIESANVYLVGSKKYKVQDVVSNSFTLAMLIGFSATMVFLGIYHLNFFQKFIDINKISPTYLWIVFFIPIYLLISFFREIIRGTGDIVKYNILRIAECVLQIVTITIFLLILKKGVSGAIFSYGLAMIGVFILTIISIRKIARITFSLNQKLVKESFKYGGKVYIANVISYLNYRISLIFVGAFLIPFSVGIYSLAAGISEKLLAVSRAFATVLFPTVSSFNNSQADNLTPRVVRHTILITIMSSLLLTILAKPLIGFIFGQDFLPSVTPLLILLPGIIAFSIGGVVAADLAGRGKPQFAVYSSIACLVINVLLSILLIPKWGINGAALATSIAYSVDTLVILIAFLKICKKPLKEVLFIQKEDLKEYLRILSNLRNCIKVKS